MDWSILLVVIVIFLATLIRSAFGFGEALVAVPLLAMLIPVEEAVPLATLVSITVAGVVVVQDWHHIHVRSAGWLIVSTLFGIPLGLWLLTAISEAVVKASLATVILAFSLYCLVSQSKYELKSDRWAWLFGFCAGVLGGAYGMNGPPLVIYGSLRHWSPSAFPGHVARLFPAREFDRHVRLLAGRPVDAGRDSQLLLVITVGLGSDIPGAGDQSTHERSRVSPLHPHRSAICRRGIVDSALGR